MKHLKLVLLISTIFLSGGGIFTLMSVNARNLSATSLSTVSQTRPPLTFDQLVRAITQDRKDDLVIASEIEQRGVSFEVNEDSIQRLRRLGAGERTIKALPCPSDSSKYGFEKADEILWRPQKSGDSQAITEVTQSEKGRAKSGCYSLKLTVDLAGGIKNKSQGEAYVEMIRSAPREAAIPADLESVEITVWMYVPEKAAGDQNSQNSVQVFVKDQNNKSEYGSWFKLPGYTDKWIPVKLTPSKEKPQDGHKDDGFEPTKIVIVGIKIGAGDNSTTIFKGPIYVDGVNWENK